MPNLPEPPASPSDDLVQAEFRAWARLYEARDRWIEGFRPADLPSFEKSLSQYVESAEAILAALKHAWLYPSAP
jgi:hypothetical protein